MKNLPTEPGKFKPGKNGFAATVFEVDPEFGFSGQQRRIRVAFSYIDFGSTTWTVTGTWTNSTTDTEWDAGTKIPTVFILVPGVFDALWLARVEKIVQKQIAAGVMNQ